MKKRKLGSSGLEIAPLALGGNVFGWTIDQPTSFQILDTYLGEGFNFIDTADAYSAWVPGNRGGESETILGNWFKERGNRKRVILATKVGMEMGPQKKGLSKAYMIKAAEDSLRRLQTDYIDLYQSHIDDTSTPLEETLEVYATLIKQGKVKAIGASNYSGERLFQAIKVSKLNDLPSYQTLQPLYNLCEREEYEKKLEPVCEEMGLGVITYFSLASGFLTGKYRQEKDFSKSARGERVKKYLNPRGLRILDALDEVSETHQSKPSRVALAWLLARPSVTAPIASATSVEQLHELVESTKLVLDHHAINLLNQASDPAALEN